MLDAFITDDIAMGDEEREGERMIEPISRS